MTSRAMADIAEPRYCQCLHNLTPSPWHCACGRWKPASVEQCGQCAAGLVDTDLNPARALIEYWRDPTVESA